MEYHVSCGSHEEYFLFASYFFKLFIFLLVTLQSLICSPDANICQQFKNPKQVDLHSFVDLEISPSKPLSLTPKAHP